jgi:hypothetical protein
VYFNDQQCIKKWMCAIRSDSFKGFKTAILYYLIFYSKLVGPHRALPPAVGVHPETGRFQTPDYGVLEADKTFEEQGIEDGVTLVFMVRQVGC